MFNNRTELNSLALGDTYLDFIPMLTKTSSLVVDSSYTESYRVDSLIKVEPGYCYQENFRFQGTPRFFSLQSQNWITLLLLFQFFIYAYVLVRSGKFWAESFRDLLQVKERSSLFLDTSMRDPRQHFSLTLLSGINLGFVLYVFISSNSIYFENKSLAVLLFLLAGILFFILKFIFVNFLGFVFFGHSSALESFKESLFTLISFLGIVLYPIVLLLIYAPVNLHGILFILGFVSYILFVLFKSYRLLKFFYVEIYSFFYLILYLCTLEILPGILLYLTLVKIEQII